MSKNKSLPRKVQNTSGLLITVVVLLPFIALVPLIFDPPFFIDTHLPTKELVYFASALMVVAIAGWKFFRHPTPFAVLRSDLMLFASLGLFFIWQMLSLLWSPNAGYGLRDAGIWLCLGIFLVLAVKVLDARSVVWLQYSLSIISLILSITQIAEYSKGNPSPSIFFNFGMTAELLTVMLPLQVAACLAARERLLVILSTGAAGLGWLALCETLRRGPIVGALLGLFILVVALLPKLIKLQDWRRLASLATLMVLATGLQVSGLIIPQSIASPTNQAGALPVNDLKWRVQDAINIGKQSVQPNQPTVQPAAPAQPNSTLQSPAQEAQTSSLGERLRYWAIGMEMIKRHPWHGIGIAGWPAKYMNYRRYYLENPSYARLHKAETSADEYGAGSLAHNEYVQILAELGLVGLILFLIWAVQLGWQLWQKTWQLRGTLFSYIPIGSIAGLVAFAVSSAVSNFSFRQVPSTVVAVSLMGLGLAKVAQDEESSESKNDNRIVWLSKPALTAVLTMALVLTAIVTWHGYHALQSQRLQAEPDLQFSPNDPSKNQAWLAQYQEALEHDPYNYGAHFGCGLLLYQMKRPQEAVPHLEAAKRLGYDRPFTNVLLAFAYEQTGQLNQGVEVLSASLASFPDSFLARYAYIEFLRKKGDLEGSRRELEILRQKNEIFAKCLPLIMRMKPTAAVEEATRQGLPVPPYDIFPQLIDRAMLQMRTFHYLSEASH